MVHSYPNTSQIQDWIDGTNRPAALSTWKTMTSSWSVNMSTRPQTVAEAAYDLWFDDWNEEVMIQVAFTGDKLRPRCDVNGDVINTVTFGGTAVTRTPLEPVRVRFGDDLAACYRNQLLVRQCERYGYAHLARESWRR